MTAIALALAALGLGITIILSMVFMVVGPGPDSWFRRPWKLGRNPLQLALVATLVVTGLAFALLSAETQDGSFLFLTALGALMAVATYGGPNARLAIWAGATIVVISLITLWVAKHGA
jgi:hypothetical protein